MRDHNHSLKNKIQELEMQEKILNIENAKISLEKWEWSFGKEEWLVDVLSFYFFLWTKIFWNDTS